MFYINFHFVVFIGILVNSVILLQAIKMLAETGNSIPLIFLITDGSVDNEREICNLVKASLKSGNTISPRLCTFGIGKTLPYCS